MLRLPVEKYRVLDGHMINCGSLAECKRNGVTRIIRSN